MTAREQFDRQLSAWLVEQAPIREPEGLLGQVLARTARTRRRPAWRLPERWLPMSAITSRFAPATAVPWRGLAVAVLILALLVAGLVAFVGSQKPRALPFGPAANGSIFYSQDGDIFARPNGGTEAVSIIAGDTRDDAPVLSPDGTKLSFLRHPSASTVELWVADVDGGNRHRLDVPERAIGWFEWSPEGDVAVVLDDADPTAMLIVPTNGGTRARYDLGVRIEQPVFRPTTGSQIAFLGTAASGDRGIYLVNRDGTGLVRLELDPGHRDDTSYPTDQSFYFWTMSWSPSGDRVLYTQLEPLTEAAAGPGFRVRLATVDGAGGVESDELVEFDPATDDEFAPGWLPTGDGFVFQNVEGSRHWLSTASLGPSGPGAARTLDVMANDWIGFQVSPDGSQVLAVLPTTAGRPGIVEIVDLASGRVERHPLGEDASWQRRPR